MANNNHDTLVYRLAQMLVKLNQGEKLVPLALAEEFGVNLRTIVDCFAHIEKLNVILSDFYYLNFTCASLFTISL